MGVATSLDGDTCTFPLPVLQDSPLAYTRSRVGRSHRDVVGFLVALLRLWPLRWLPRRGLHHGVAPSTRVAAWAVVVVWGGRGGPARCDPAALAKPIRL